MLNDRWNRLRPPDGYAPNDASAGDLDPRHRGSESWASGPGLEGLFNARGQKISDAKPRFCNFAAWWDGDLLRELTRTLTKRSQTSRAPVAQGKPDHALVHTPAIITVVPPPSPTAPW
jgi:hypothetical protein